MEDEVDVALDLEVVADVLLLEAVVRVVLEVLEVGRVAGDEIIDPDNAIAFRQKAIGQMAAQESGSAGDNCGFHEIISKLSS